MEANKIRLYGYRWVVLSVFMFINLTIQILWISYAPITGVAAKYYGVSDLQIGFSVDAVHDRIRPTRHTCLLGDR